MLKKNIKQYNKILNNIKTDSNSFFIQSIQKHLIDLFIFAEQQDKLILSSNNIDQLEEYYLEIKNEIHKLHAKGNVILEKIYKLKEQKEKK